MNADERCEWPLSIAVEELTGFEVIAIQGHYRTDISELGAVRLTCAVVWAMANRGVEGAAKGAVSWADVEGLSLRRLNGYFPPDPEPGTDLGKG